MLWINIAIMVAVSSFAYFMGTKGNHEAYMKGRAHAYIEVAEALRNLESEVSPQELASQLAVEAVQISRVYKK